MTTDEGCGSMSNEVLLTNECKGKFKRLLKGENRPAVIEANGAWAAYEVNGDGGKDDWDTR